MKTVIVIDTDDPIGMESTRRIVDHLLETHHTRQLQSDPFSSKIRAIKTLRAYVNWCQKQYPDDWEKMIGSLKGTKNYVDQHEWFLKGGKV